MSQMRGVRRRATVRSVGCVVLAMGLTYSLSAQPASAAQSTWTPVDAAMGRAGATQAGGVHRYAFPRSDLTVTVADPAGAVVIKPAFALGGWLAMHHTGTAHGVMAMGDIVVTDTELTPVIRALQAGGIEQTAVHHHVIRESPRVLYVHVHAMGDPVRIARTIRSAVALTGAPPAPSGPAPAPAALDLNTVAVTEAIGYPGRANGGVWQVNVPRVEVIRTEGMTIPGSMGLGTVINFQPTGSGRAAITGDFVLLASEVNPVIKALSARGIEVTSLHNHMLGDEPRLFFMHFWAHADAIALARGLREALALTNVVRQPDARHD